MRERGVLALRLSLILGGPKFMEYDEDAALTAYVWAHHVDRMSESERRADRAGMAEVKARNAESGGDPRMARMLRKDWGGEGDAEVQAALADGFEAFRRRVMRRLLADPNLRDAINRCPSCRRVVRTPLARQCLWCGHDWHERM